ncbi:glycosyltransferase family 39 protein [Jatrophihabitans fulvus]
MGPGALQAVALALAVRVVGVLGLVVGASRTGRDAHARLTRWDADWYVRIAAHGYGTVVTAPDGRALADYAFFPLYPLLERWLHAVSPLGYADAGLLIAWLSTAVAAAGVYAVGERVSGRGPALLLVGLWAALPVADVLSMAYSEALFTALAAWSLHATLTRRWLLAGVLAALAGLTRPLGVAVAAAVIVAAVLEWRRVRGPAPLAGAVIAPLGPVGYLGWVALRRHDVGGYLEVTRGWHNGLDGGRAFAAWVGRFFADGSWPIGVLLVLAVAALVGLFVLGVRDRQPPALLVYTGVLVAMAFGTSGYFGSKPRYLLPAFALLLPLAVRLAGSRWRWVVVGGLAVVSSVYGAVWLLGSGPP